MKSVIISTLLIVIFINSNLMAQPLPPTTPDGNPVPVGLAAGFLLFAGLFLMMKRRKK